MYPPLKEHLEWPSPPLQVSLTDAMDQTQNDEILKAREIWYPDCKLLQFCFVVLILITIDPLTILRAPCQKWFQLDAANIKKMEKYFSATFSMLSGHWVTVTEVREFVKNCRFDRWSKVRVGNRGDHLRGAVAFQESRNARDNSFVRVSATLFYLIK